MPCLTTSLCLLDCRLCFFTVTYSSKKKHIYERGLEKEKSLKKDHYTKHGTL